MEDTIRIGIEKAVRTSYDITGFVTSREYIKNMLSVSFTCVPDKDFFSKTITLEWGDITNAIESIWKGEIDISCESDINNDIKLYQTH